MNTRVPYIILSAAVPGNSPELVTEKSKLLDKQLGARGFTTQLLTEKKSIVVYLATPEDHAKVDYVYQLARRYGQTCVLESDANGRREWVYLHPGAGGVHVKSREKLS